MANYDVLYTLIVPISNASRNEVVGTTTINIIEFNLTGTYFDRNLVPSGTDIMLPFNGYIGYISLKDNQHFSDFLAWNNEIDYLGIQTTGPSESGVTYTFHFNSKDVTKGSTITARDAYLIINTTDNTLYILWYNVDRGGYYRTAIASLNTYDLQFSQWVEYNRKPVNFYANPSEYEANNGETVTPNFVLVYDDDSIVEPFTDITYDESVYFKDNISTLDEDGITITISPNNTIKRLNYIVRPNVESEVNLFAAFHIDVLDAKNPYFPEGDSTTGGGGGGYGSGEDYFGTTGLIPDGTVETNDSAGSLYTRYAMNLTDLNNIGNYFWAEDLGLQIAKTLISLLYGDPVQTIISCVSYPFDITSLTGTFGTGLRWGGHDTGLTMQALNSNGFQIDWGTITIYEYWGNFLDYSPFTKFQLYLPWGTGFVDIDPNDVMRAKGGIGTTAGGNGTLSVKTNVEVSRGMCVHHVIANNTVIGSYSGSCGRQIPITGSDYASKQVAIAGAAVGTMMAGAVTAGLGHMSGTANATREFVTAPSSAGFGPPTVQETKRVFNKQAAKATRAAVGPRAIRPAIASAAALAVSPPHVSRSGSFQEGTGSLTIQSPYLIISRPKMSMPYNYGNLYGYPSNIYSNLGSLSGYTEVGSIHLDGIPATMEELSEIDDLLKGGVIL